MSAGYNLRWPTLALAVSLVFPAPVAGVTVNIKGGGSPPVAPPAAHAAGFEKLTFHTSVFSGSTVDAFKSYKPGWQWYIWNFFSVTVPISDVQFYPDGSVVLLNDTYGGGNGEISTAALAPGSTTWIGTAFGGGGYFEAEISFDPAKVDLTRGWPAWWTMSLEHLVGLAGDQWVGQPYGYKHFFEGDILGGVDEVDSQIT